MRGIGLHSKILYSLLAVMLALAVLPLVAVSWRLISTISGSLAAAQREQQLAAVRDYAREAEHVADRYFAQTKMYARALELAGGAGAAEAEEWRREVRSRDEHLLALAVVAPDGTFLLANRAAEVGEAEFERLAREAVDAAASGEPYFGAPRVLGGGAAAAPMGAPIRAGGRAEGAVVAVLDVRRAFRFPPLAAVEPGRREPDRRPLAGPLHAVVDASGAEVASAARPGTPGERGRGGIAVVDEWLAGGARAAELAREYTGDDLEGGDEELLGALAAAELPGGHRLGVVSVVDRAAAFAVSDRMRSQAIWACLFAAFVAFLVALLFARHVAAPIRDLARGARAIAGGDFSHRIRVRSVDEFGQLGTDFNAMAERLEQYVEELRQAAEDSRALFIGTVQGLAAAIDGKDPYTRGHSERVADYSAAMAAELGLPPEEIEKIRIGGLMHDIGKLAIEDKILRKPAPLTDEEFDIMREHPERGTKIMSQIPQMREYISGMRFHHEMMNGKGYPLGLVGEQIPLMARIVSVADTFDAMTTNRPYQKQLPIDLVFEKIKGMAGERYDPKVVGALVAAYESGRIKLKLQKAAR